jgi:hypothetical protein
MFIVQTYQIFQYVVPRGVIFSCNIHGVHCVGLSDFLERGAARRHFYRQVAQLFRRKFLTGGLKINKYRIIELQVTVKIKFYGSLFINTYATLRYKRLKNPLNPVTQYDENNMDKNDDLLNRTKALRVGRTRWPIDLTGHVQRL